jgi:hypothetical protein
MVEGSKFKESLVFENTKLWNKVGRMPRPLVLFRPSNSGLASFCACFRISCPWQIMPLRQPSHLCDGGGVNSFNHLSQLAKKAQELIADQFAILLYKVRGAVPPT